MADQFTSVSEQGLGGSLMDSIKGVAAGALLFFVSFLVLWMNEGRVDLSEIAKKSTAVKPDAVDSRQNGKFVSVTGALTSEDKVGDPELLNPGSYIKLDRAVEMFAWVEKKESKTETKLGGKKVTTTTITYAKEWTTSPKRPSDFERPEGHENPALPLESEHFAAAKAMVGSYSFNPGDPALRLPSGDPLKLTDDMVKGAADEPAADAPKAAGAAAAKDGGDGDSAKADDGAAKDEAKSGDDDDDDDKPAKSKKSKSKSKKDKKDKSHRKHHGRSKKRVLPPVTKATVDNAERKADAIARRKPQSFTRASETYLYKGSGSLGDPQVGDARVSFVALNPGITVTLFGQLDGGQVVPYSLPKDEGKLFRAELGTRDQAIAQLRAEHKAIGWVLRIVGFAMMWIGLMLFFGPINALLDIVPFLGSAGRFLIGIAMFPVALVLSSITILLSIIAHSPILLALFIVGLAAGAYFLYQKKKKAG